MTRLLPLARRFRDDERGSIAVETMLILPVMVWFYLGMFVFFDGFRAAAVNIKAAYTIGDVLSRQTAYITPEFMDSLYSLQDVLTDTDSFTALRVTTYKYRSSDNSYQVVWSQGRGGPPAQTTASLLRLSDRIPAMANGDVAVMTETWMDYDPPIEVGVEPFRMSEVVVTRPRFALNGRFCWNSVNDNGGQSTETC